MGPWNTYPDTLKLWILRFAAAPAGLPVPFSYAESTYLEMASLIRGRTSSKEVSLTQRDPRFTESLQDYYKTWNIIKSEILRKILQHSINQWK